MRRSLSVLLVGAFVLGIYVCLGFSRECEGFGLGSCLLLWDHLRPRRSPFPSWHRKAPDHVGAPGCRRHLREHRVLHMQSRRQPQARDHLAAKQVSRVLAGCRGAPCPPGALWAPLCTDPCRRPLTLVLCCGGKGLKERIFCCKGGALCSPCQG